MNDSLSSNEPTAKLIAGITLSAQFEQSSLATDRNAMNREKIAKIVQSSADTALTEPPPLYAERIQLVAIAMNGYHLRHLGCCYQMFDGDLAQAIVLGEIGLHHHSGEIGTDKNPTTQQLFDILVREHILTVTPGPISASALSRSTGIPRETIRRKIARLMRLGWIVKKPQGGYIITAKPVKHFGPSFNIERLNDFLDTAARLRALVAT